MAYPTAFPGYQAPQQGFGYQPTTYLPQLQNAPQSQQAGPQHGFRVQPVTSREEAMAVQTDFFGLGTILPALAQGVIWVKRFNPCTGASDMLEFRLVQPIPIRETADGKMDPIDFLRKLITTFDELQKGVVTDVPDEQPGNDVGASHE